MPGSISPFVKIGSSQVSSDYKPPKHGELNDAEIIQLVASKENVQDYVAALFTGTQHQNATFTYDDANNTLTLSVVVDGIDLTELETTLNSLDNNSGIQTNDW